MGVTVLDLGPSGSLSVPQDLCITGMSLQAGNPACAGGDQRVVNVWAEDRHEAYLIGTLSSEEPIVPVQPQVVVGDELVLRHDGVAATVRFYARVAGPTPPPSVSEAEEEATVLEEGGGGEDEASWVEFHPLSEEGEADRYDSDAGEEDEMTDEASWVEYHPLSEEEEAERYDSDDSEEDEDDEPPRKVRHGETTGESSRKSCILPLVAAPPGTVVPDGQFLGPPRFASVENTAGFMRVAAAAVAEDATMDHDRKEISVFYRYTRFSRTWSGRRGVEPCRRTKLHRLRFAVPPVGDMASSLAWAGASLGPLVYPALFRPKLQELWTILAAAAAPPAIIDTIPPRATRLQVIVDVAILRREDCTLERMAYMRAALEEEMQESWPDLYHVGIDLHLPEPVRREDEQGGEDARPAKRRKIVDDDEECSLCFDPLESDLAAWPGCRHVFHGACVEKTLARSEMCPLCRTKLSGQLVG